MKEKERIQKFIKDNIKVIIILLILFLLLLICCGSIYVIKGRNTASVTPTPTVETSITATPEITTTIETTVTATPEVTTTTTTKPTNKPTSKPTSIPIVTTISPILLTSLGFSNNFALNCNQTYTFNLLVGSSGTGVYTYRWEYNDGSGWKTIGQFNMNVISGTNQRSLTTPFVIQVGKTYSIRVVSISPNNIPSKDNNLGSCTPDIGG